MSPNASQLSRSTILDAAGRAARAIAPLWPLASSVAVNPFLGHTGESLAVAAARLRRVAGVALTQPRAWYADQLRTGQISDADLGAALKACTEALRPASIVDLQDATQSTRPAPQALPTVADLASGAAGLDWSGVVAERISHWAAGYFDEGQALWATAQQRGAYAAWRAVAIHDVTPEIIGLAGFAARVADTPESAETALVRAVHRLGLSVAALDSYFHRLLMTLGGWAQLARYRLWQAELVGDTDATLIELLAVCLIWEESLLEQYAPDLQAAWQQAVTAHAQPVLATFDDCVDGILQEAAERAAQGRLQAILSGPSAETLTDRPALQIAFCIDVRSEVFRRALETLDPAIQTLGFAGFFGLGIAHRRFASDVVEARLPVLLTPGLNSCSGPLNAQTSSADQAARFAARAKRAWGRFKLAAVSSFAFVEATGPIYIGRLLRDSLGLRRAAVPDEPAPRPASELDLDTRLNMASSVLTAMSLTDRYAPLVLLAGHGANVVNNPHASALHCGACGGYSGEVNARLLASLLNDREVRSGLIARGIHIPDDTLFLGALHDTTTDQVKLYAADHPSVAHAPHLQQAQRWLGAAGTLARGERALRLPRANQAKNIPRRARDWSELRPEWALAGCQAFIAAPRTRSSGRNLAGRAFLHDYDWRRDHNFGVLELILTAPVVVASWISLQYYGSTVAPDTFGAGNKLLHNVSGGIGVVEGNGGLLRVGLPWQSVHDGERLIHEPLRLTVLIEAPHAAINAILERHPAVRALFDNRWLHLCELDDSGHMAWRYSGDLRWELDAPSAAGQLPQRNAAA